MRTFGEVVEEPQHLFGRFGHLGGQRVVGVGIETEQLRQFLAQRQRFLDDRGVVVLAGLGPLVGSAGDVGGIDFATQLAIFGEGHDRQETGHVEGNPVAGLALGFGIRLERFEGAFRQAAQALGIAQVQLPGLRRVEQLVGEGVA